MAAGAEGLAQTASYLGVGTWEAAGEPPRIAPPVVPPLPTPDHPPYSWMIGEAIAALSEDGGSAEAAISDFIRARYPGVPTAHGRLLRHYLAKHVAEGLFVCTASGRYSASLDEPALVEVPAVKPVVAVTVGSPVAEAKRCCGRDRGRPRKDGSTPTSAAGKKGESKSPSAAPNRCGRGRGRPRKDGSSPKSAAGKKGVGESPSATRKGRGRPRKLAPITTTDISRIAHVTDKKDGSESPSTTDKNHGQPHELALVIVNDGSTMTYVTEKDGGEAPPTTPMNHDQACNLAFSTAADVSAPTPLTDKKDAGGAPPPKLSLALVAKDDGAAAFTTPERSTQLCKLAPVATADVSALAPVADEKGGGEAPSAKYKRRRRPCKSAPVMNAGKVGGKAQPTTKARGRQRRPAVAATTATGSAPSSVADKKDECEVPSATLKLALVTAGGGSALTSLAGKKDDNEAPLALALHCLPGKLYPLNADEIPDNWTTCVLALPAQMAATMKA